MVRRSRPFAAILSALALVAIASAVAVASQGYPVAGTAVDYLTGQPLAGFLVTLTPDKGGTGQTVSTSANGQFSFTSIPVGKYILSGSGPGYRAQGLNQHDNYFTGVAVGPELDSTHILFRLQADASIRGQVIDEQSEPIRNATAQLFRIEEVDGIRRAESTGTAGTNDQGVYHFSHLAPGMYYVGISARPWYAQYLPQGARTSPPQVYDASGSPVGHLQIDSEAATRAREEAAQLDVAYPLTFYPATDDSSQATAITLRAGERFSADITMRAVPTAHLKIRDDKQPSGPGPAPSLTQRVFDGLLIPVFSSQAMASGRTYEFEGLAPGHYTLEFTGRPEKSGGSSGWFRDIDLYGDMEISASESPTMATVTGLVSYDGAPPPRQDTYIELRNNESGDSWTSKVSEKGLFGLKENELRPGSYQALLYGSTEWMIAKIVAQNAAVKGTEITLASGASARLVCTLTRVSAALKGTVLRDDKPFVGAMVLLVPDALQDKQRYRRDESDSDGTFSLRQVVPGKYTAVAIQNGWDLEWGNPDVLKPYLAKGEKITVTPDKNPDLKLQAQ